MGTGLARVLVVVATIATFAAWTVVGDEDPPQPAQIEPPSSVATSEADKDPPRHEDPPPELRGRWRKVLDDVGADWELDKHHTCSDIRGARTLLPASTPGEIEAYRLAEQVLTRAEEAAC